MAITKTIFTGATAADQAPEILAWLQANAADYFDSITYDSENKTIVCSEDGQVALVLGVSELSQKRFTIYSRNGASFESNASIAKYAYGIATPTAIYLVTDDTRKNHVIVTNNNDGQLFMVAKITYQSSTNTSRLIVCDYYNSPTAGSPPYIYSNSYTTFEESFAFGTALTSLTPITAPDYPTYTPNVYFEFFNEYSGVAGKVYIGGTEYFSNGYIAMKG